jgi:pyruvate-ferredoxin/flavodoxin oxidoreductase
MSTRATGYAMIVSNSPQEVMDLALIAQESTLASRIPFLHFFDGFRTSHEIRKIEEISDEDIIAMIDYNLVIEHRKRAMNPERPVIRGTSQNPDVFFQARETVNTFYDKCPGIVQEVMDKFKKVVGREYNLFDYVGAPDAEKVVVIMGSGGDTAHETVNYLAGLGEKVGLIKVRLYRPFSECHFINALPKTTKIIAAMDRTKEPGNIGEPLYLDVTATVANSNRDIKVVGGRYGLSCKEFTPAMIKGIFD